MVVFVKSLKLLDEVDHGLDGLAQLLFGELGGTVWMIDSVADVGR